MSMLEIHVARWPATSESSVLRDVSLQIEAGEVWAVSGESGSGKSALLRCMVGFTSFEGSLKWRGETVRDFVAHRSHVGFLHQRAVAIADTLGENLSFAREHGKWSADEQRHALQKLGLRDWESSERFDRFSGGEQQRVALVRLLTSAPDLLLLDEPTASLDTERARELEDFVHDWRDEGRAVVWVTHDDAQRERLKEWSGARAMHLERAEESTHG
jgi:ABC-type iron transport system FetAB ATPase subunit